MLRHTEIEQCVIFHFVYVFKVSVYFICHLIHKYSYIVKKINIWFARIIAPSTTPLPCADKIDDCESYGQNVCSEPRYIAWVLENCRYFCRQCSGENKYLNYQDSVHQFNLSCTIIVYIYICTNFVTDKTFL